LDLHQIDKSDPDPQHQLLPQKIFLTLKLTGFFIIAFSSSVKKTRVSSIRVRITLKKKERHEYLINMREYRRF
jgi:hypothetical protein